MKIAEIAADGGTIGIEDGTTNYLPEGFITNHEYQTLKAMFPKAELVNCAEITDRLCLIKEPAEIKLMRQATAIVDKAHEAVRQALSIGMSEKQIAGIAEKVMRDAGSEFAWTFTGGQEIASGERTWWPLGGCTPATDRLVQLGEPVLVDLHGMYGLFLGDVSHNYIMGRPTKEQREVMTAYTETAYKVIDEMKPGKVPQGGHPDRPRVRGQEQLERLGAAGLRPRDRAPGQRMVPLRGRHAVSRQQRAGLHPGAGLHADDRGRSATARARRGSGWSGRW